MTQLIIAGVETVLPQNFSIAVKRENPLFTKSGEYTYDITLNMDNPVNQRLYGFLNRLNKVGQVDTQRTALLMANGRVYCRGTEIVTRWTDKTVSIQIVSGESELNYFIGSDKKVSELQMASCSYSWVQYINTRNYETDPSSRHDLSWPTYNCCFPMIYDKGAGITYNQYCQNEWDNVYEDTYVGNRMPALRTTYTQLRPQPFLCALVRGIIEALGYEIGTDELATHETFKRAFIVNTVDAQSLDETLPGWTVKEFLEQVEKLTGCLFYIQASDNENVKGRVHILLKTTYYMSARQILLNDVIDEYETEVQSESDDTDQTTATLKWQLPNNDALKLACVPDSLKKSVRIITVQDSVDINPQLISSITERTMIHDEESDTYWIRDSHTVKATISEVEREVAVDSLHMVDYLRPLERENAPTMEMEIVPAIMDWWWFNRDVTWEPNDVLVEPIKTIIVSESDSSENEDSEEQPSSFSDLVRESSEPSEPSKAQLYVALFNGLQQQECGVLIPQPYIDAFQARMEDGFMSAHHQLAPAHEGFEGSLLLPQLNETAYSVCYAYQIDTQHAITFETFDPNRIDVRQVYIVNNKRYVVRDCEETITAEGRKPLWKLTCYPITISDEAIEKRWILTRGAWDDGGAWLDDGRWLDG